MDPLPAPACRDAALRVVRNKTQQFRPTGWSYGTGLRFFIDPTDGPSQGSASIDMCFFISAFLPISANISVLAGVMDPPKQSRLGSSAAARSAAPAHHRRALRLRHSLGGLRAQGGSPGAPPQVGRAEGGKPGPQGLGGIQDSALAQPTTEDQLRA